MTRLLMCAALLCALAACSDDKASSSSSSGSESSSTKETDAPENAKDSEQDPAKDPDEKTDGPIIPDKTDDPQPAAERGFKESKQPEGETLDGKEIVADTYYKGGERLKVSSLGFSFIVPEGDQAVIASNGAAINVGAVGGKFLTLIIARTGVTEAEARDMLSQPYPMGNTQLVPQGEIAKSGDRLSRAMSSPALVGHAQMLIGKSAAVALATFALPGEESSCKTISGKLADSVKFAVPAGEKQRLEHEAGMKGKCAHVFKFKSAKDYSWSSETNKYWHFGSDHTYEYFSRNTNSGSYESGSYAADNDAAHSGTWSIELTLSLPTLILRTNDGRIITHVLSVVKGYLNIDGQEAMLKASDRKR